MTGPTIGARHYGETHKWTPTEDILILDMAKRGFSAREIARKVSEDTTDHITRLSVIGRLSRLHWKNPRTKSQQCVSRSNTKKAERKIQILKPKPLPPIQDESHLPSISALQASDRHCAWYIGDPKNLRRCRFLAVSGCSWCALHAQHVFAGVKLVETVSHGVA